MRQFDPFANIAISQSNGEPTEKDFATFRLHEAREAEGLCPNGCGPITWLDAHNRECSVCKFHGWSNMPNEDYKNS